MAEGGTQEAQIEISEDEERELEILESDVTEMATKIAECRDTLPNQLTSTLASLLTAQRPVLSSSFDFGSDPGPSGHSASGGIFLDLHVFVINSLHFLYTSVCVCE